MMSEQALPRAFAVWFKDIARWDPSSVHNISWHWPAEVMKPLGSVLKIRKEKVNRAELAFTDLQPITIHFDGSLDRRKVDPKRAYTMDLYFARPGDIVVAKIDLKNGAVGVVPWGWENVVVTGHFAVYEPDLTQVVPEYLLRLIQTRFFKAHLNRNKVGAEGRKEVKLAFFEAEPIPLPPLPVQEAIVAQWEEAQADVRAIREHFLHMEGVTSRLVLDVLGLKRPKLAEVPKAFAVSWKDFERWSVSYNKAVQSGVDLALGKYPFVPLGSILDLLQYGTSEKANTRNEGVAVVRMNNIVNGELVLANLKHLALSPSETKSLRLQEGDILFNRTNSKELVGKCAVYHPVTEDKVFVFASYLIRVRVKADIADPDFIAAIVNSSLGRSQINAMSRQIIGQANVNSQELRSLQIPLPPLDTQREIVQRVQTQRQEMARLREQAERKAREIKADVEALILGTKRPAELPRGPEA